MSVVASVVEYAQSIARAGVAAALAFSIGTQVDDSNRVGCYADVTAAAEKLTFVVGGVTGPSLDRTGSQVIVTGLVVSDSSFTVADNSDPTKILTFQCGSLTSGFGLVIDTGAQAANRTLSVPVLGGNRTLAVIDQAQTISAQQTLTLTPIVSALTASRLVRTNASKELESNAALTNTHVLVADANGWPAGSAGLTWSGSSLAATSSTATTLSLDTTAAGAANPSLVFSSGGTQHWYFFMAGGVSGDKSFGIYDGIAADNPLAIASGTAGAMSSTRPFTLSRNTGTTLVVSSTQASTNSTTGAQIITGGLGVGGSIYAGATVGGLNGSITQTLNIGTGASGNGLTINHSLSQAPISLVAGSLPTTAGRISICFSGGATANNPNRFMVSAFALEDWVSSGASGCEIRFEVAAIGSSSRTTAMHVSASSVQIKSATLLAIENTTTSSTLTSNAIYSAGGVGVADGKNLNFGTTTGSMIGSGATQKLALWGATPVVRPSTISDPAGGATIDAEARTAINSIIDLLQSIGAMT